MKFWECLARTSGQNENSLSLLLSLSWHSRLSWRLKSQFQSHSSTFSLASVVIHPLRNTIICGCVLSLRISKKPYQLAKNGKDGFKAAHGNALRKSIDCVLHFYTLGIPEKKVVGCKWDRIAKRGKRKYLIKYKYFIFCFVLKTVCM